MNTEQTVKVIRRGPLALKNSAYIIMFTLLGAKRPLHRVLSVCPYLCPFVWLYDNHLAKYLLHIFFWYFSLVLQLWILSWLKTMTRRWQARGPRLPSPPRQPLPPSLRWPRPSTIPFPVSWTPQVLLIAPLRNFAVRFLCIEWTIFSYFINI